MSDFPQSVEEAAALLGASITTYGKVESPTVAPPKGMHSAFAARKVASAELMCRLRDLRSFLKSSPAPLASAPSIIDLLNKILPLSAKMANSESKEVPILLSNPLRKLWVDCVCLCHALNENLPATQLVRKMTSIALLNPRSQKAAGGVRVAALEVIAGLFKSKELAKTLAPWTTEVLQLCSKALKSAGNGEPTYRIAAIQVACATTVACRQRGERLLLEGVLEPPALNEAVRLIRSAMVDKCPRVRCEVAQFAAMLAPLLVGKDGAGHLEDLLLICWKNMDDEASMLLTKWVEAWARCALTAIVYNKASKDKKDGDGRFVARRLQIVPRLSSLKNTIQYLVQQYIKVGGESVAQRFGGTFSVGGRSARVAVASCLSEVLSCRSLLPDGDSDISIDSIVDEILQILVEDDKAKGSDSLFGSARASTLSDLAVSRECTSHALRYGVIASCSETMQISILQYMCTILGKNEKGCNSNQRQVVLGEVSHLISCLGLACSGHISELIECLERNLVNPDVGVRHQAVHALVAISLNFPDHGLSLLKKSIDIIKEQHATNLATSAISAETADGGKGMRLFRRSPKKEKSDDLSVGYQNAVHGWSLLTSFLVRLLPEFQQDIPSVVFKESVSVAQTLVACQFDKAMCESSPSSVCTCVRSGFFIFSGSLSCGPKHCTLFVESIVEALERCSSEIKSGSKLAALRHQIFCLDAMLSTTVAFLKFCGELLLSIPDVLHRITVILEDMLPLFTANGRFQSESISGIASTSLESARASLLESYAWLPSGSFPVAADDVFALAAQIIQDAGDQDMPCSVLRHSVNSEDDILDARSLESALLESQIGYSNRLAEVFTLVSAEVFHVEIESIMHLRPVSFVLSKSKGRNFRSSVILGTLVLPADETKAPTPLHEVGAWKRPIDPSKCSKTRLIDAAIQAFAATFGLKDGSEQQKAMDMLEAMIPPFLSQLARTIGVTTVLAENERRSKTKEDLAAVTNITAVLLSCLQAMPLQDSTHNVAIGMGPPWMNKAKDLLLTLLPSTSNLVRRAAAEALAHLATLGVSDEAHMMQSKVLMSLDEVMHGNKPEGKRSISLNPISVARSGALLTLGSIQRTAYHVMKKQDTRARNRAKQESDSDASRRSRALLPFFQMFARTLSSSGMVVGAGDQFVVSANAIHAIGLMISYSNRLETAQTSLENKQVLLKAFEIVQSNFIESWTIVSNDLDRYQELEKLPYEATFLAALIRLTTCMVPALAQCLSNSSELRRTLESICYLSIEMLGNHSSVAVEALALGEVILCHLTASKDELAPALKQDEMPIMCLLYHPRRIIQFDRPCIFVNVDSDSYTNRSFSVIRAASILIESYFLRLPTSYQHGFDLLAAALARLEDTCGGRIYGGTDSIRNLTNSLVSFRSQGHEIALESNLLHLIDEAVERFTEDGTNFRLLIFLLSMLSNSFEVAGEGKTFAGNPASKAEAMIMSGIQVEADLYSFARVHKSLRWQIRTFLSFQIVKAFDSLLLLKDTQPWLFEPTLAVDRFTKVAPSFPNSFDVPAFHVEELVSLACMLSSASFDDEELFSIQEAGLSLLESVLKGFYDIQDPDLSSSKILGQFEQQIFSSVRQCLVSSQKASNVAATKSYFAASKCLVTVVRTKIASDPSSLKRICRPLLSTDELLLNATAEAFPDSPWYSLSPLEKAKLCSNIITLGDLCLSREAEERVSLEQDLTKLSISNAALAVTGASLLIRSSKSLDNRVIEDIGVELPSFLFSSAEDCDSLISELLVSNWSSCALAAIRHLTSNGVSSDTETLQHSWLDILFACVMKGANDSLDGATIDDDDDDDDDDEESPYNARILRDCLESITLLLQSQSTIPEISAQSNLLPILVSKASSVVEALSSAKDTTKSTQNDSRPIVQSCCDFFIGLSLSGESSLGSKGTLRSSMLEVLTKWASELSSERSMIIDTHAVCTAIKVLANILKVGDDLKLYSAVLTLLVDYVSNGEDRRGEIMTAISYFLTTTLGSTNLKVFGRALSSTLATSNNWKLWADIAVIEHFSLAGNSVDAVSERLKSSSPENQIEILECIFSVLRDQRSSPTLVKRILCSFGIDMQYLMTFYGTLREHGDGQMPRQKIYTILIKILSVALQQISQEEDDELHQVLLMSLFDAIVPVLQFNGLPRHPRPQPESDEVLGRLSAQFVLHAAKTVPNTFKICVQSLSEQRRQLLEYSLRAEMTGYESAHSSSGAKKKLDVSGFKRPTKV